MSTKFLSPGWRMPRNANQSKQANYSLHFTPGSVTYVSLGDALSFFIGSFSASMWVKSPNNSKEFFSRYISANGIGNFRIGCGANTGATANTVSLMTKNILLSGSTDITDGNWHHVCVTMDAISSTQYTRTIYVDGSQDAQDTVGLATYVSTSSSYGLNLGCNFPNNGHTNVDMSEVSIFDYALSSSQVTTLYGDSTSGSGNPMALPSTPIAYYPLGESAGGFVGGSGTWLTENNAIGDYVFDFDSASSDTVSVVSPPTLTGDSCLSVWIKASTNPAVAGILSSKNYSNNANSFSLQNRSGNIYFALYDSGSTYKIGNFTPSTALIDNWNHIAVVIDTVATDARIYFNKSLALTVDLSASSVDISDIVNGFSISGYSTNSSLPAVLNFFDGEISNAQIFNTALSSTEIETLYNYGSPIKTLANIPQSSNLKAWYKLDASEVYNTTTEWEVNNAQSAYQSSLNFSPRSSSNRVNLPSINLGTVNSISFWCRRLDQLSHKVLGSPTGGQNDPSIFSYLGTNVAYLSFGDGVNNYSKYFQASDPNYTLLKSDDWIHFLIVRNGNTSPNAMALYINGQTITSFNTSPTLSNDTILNTIGAGGVTGYQNSANCDISNVSIFNSALGSTDANSLYNSGSPLSDMSSFSSLVSWWKLDNTSAGVQDSKGSNNATSVQANLAIGAVSTLNGTSSGMSQANLIQSDLQTVAPYSKYAMIFDGADDYIDCGNDSSLDISGNLTISAWVRIDSPHQNYHGILSKITSTDRNYEILVRSSGQISFYTSNTEFNTSSQSIPINTWTHIAVSVESGATNGVKFYFNGVQDSTTGTQTIIANTANLNIGRRTTGSFYMDGSISNISIWNAALTSAQVTEIYNQGLPSNLNSHSAYSNLVSWWQLGENSSFAGGWICADEKGTNNGASTGMDVGALVNGVGTTANGVSSGMSEGNLIGDAPYSTANALSTNMAVTARVTGSGNTP